MPRYVFLRREAVALILGDKLRFCCYLIFLRPRGNMEMPPKYLGLIVPPFAKILEEAVH